MLQVQLVQSFRASGVMNLNLKLLSTCMEEVSRESTGIYKIQWTLSLFQATSQPAVLGSLAKQ